jgi:hypothetical protein
LPESFAISDFSGNLEGITRSYKMKTFPFPGQFGLAAPDNMNGILRPVFSQCIKKMRKIWRKSAELFTRSGRYFINNSYRGNIWEPIPLHPLISASCYCQLLYPVTGENTTPVMLASAESRSLTHASKVIGNLVGG